MPIAVPRRSRHQPAAILIPGGYTPARATPVIRRSVSPVFGPLTRQISDAVATPTIADDTAANTRGLKGSLSKRTALTSAPSTNPSCTAIVSHAAVPEPDSHSAIIPGAATVALNQGVMPNTMASANSPSWRPGLRDSITPRQASLGPQVPRPAA